MWMYRFCLYYDILVITFDTQPAPSTRFSSLIIYNKIIIWLFPFDIRRTSSIIQTQMGIRQTLSTIFQCVQGQNSKTLMTLSNFIIFNSTYNVHVQYRHGNDGKSYNHTISMYNITSGARTKICWLWLCKSFSSAVKSGVLIHKYSRSLEVFLLKPVHGPKP